MKIEHVIDKSESDTWNPLTTADSPLQSTSEQYSKGEFPYKKKGRNYPGTKWGVV